jgi:hypothetical protein
VSDPAAAQSQEWRSAQEWRRSRGHPAPGAAASRYEIRVQLCSHRILAVKVFLEGIEHTAGLWFYEVFNL